MGYKRATEIMKKKLMSLFAILCVGIMFSSCEKTSDADILDASLLWGKWSGTMMTVRMNGTYVDAMIDGETEYINFTFTNDGKFVQNMKIIGEKKNMTGSYELRGKTLTLEKGTVNETVYIINELTVSKLTIKDSKSTAGTIFYMNKVQ